MSVTTEMLPLPSNPDPKELVRLLQENLRRIDQRLKVAEVRIKALESAILRLANGGP